MKVVVYLTEPASYTIDLVKKIYLPNNISFRFIKSKSYSNSTKNFPQNLFLKNLSIFSRFKILKEDYDNFDTIFFSGYNSTTFLILWLIHIFSKNKKTISIISDTPLKIPSNILKRIIKKLYLNYIFSNKYLNGLAGGEKLQKELFRYYGMSEERIHFLPMVVDVEQFKFEPSRNRNKIFTYLFVGRFIKLKQIEIIINEFLTVFEDNKSVQLILVGDGPRYKIIHNKYSKHTNILFLGRLMTNELKQEFKFAHVLILASNNENWGLVINEAMSASLAVLSNVGIGANYDLIQNKQTGIIFNASIKGDLANKMQILYNEKEKYLSLTKNAFLLMHNYWNFKLYYKQFKIILSKLQKQKTI